MILILVFVYVEFECPLFQHFLSEHELKRPLFIILNKTKIILQALMNEDGEILHKGITLTFSSGLNFTGILETWPNNCTELAEK